MHQQLDEPCGCIVDGQAFKGSGEQFSVLEPWSGRTLATLNAASPSEVSGAVESSARAFEQWSSTPVSRRIEILTSFASSLDEHAEELASLQVRENGKLYKELLGQAQQFGDHLRYYASLLRLPVGQVIQPPIDGLYVRTERSPLGVVAAITPWNSPLNLLIWKLGPALAAGNTVIVKPSEITPLSTLRLAQIASESGLPDGVLNVVCGAAETGMALVKNPKVQKIAFTGSSAAGQEIAKSASIGMRDVSLELGGKSANIVFMDSKIDVALRGAVAGIFGASGQSCMAGSRILVQSSIYDRFLNDLTSYADNLTLGNPFEESSDMGSVASPGQLEKIEAMVSRAIEQGARVVAGGKRDSVVGFPDGLYYRPTLITDVTPDMEIFQEEVFGPVAVIVPFETEQEAIDLANDTRYGLAAGVWTENGPRADRVAKQLKSGTVWVNNYRKVAYNVPFGGFKDSGLGRENGPFCLEQFSETKCIWVDEGFGVPDPFNPRANRN